MRSPAVMVALMVGGCVGMTEAHARCDTDAEDVEAWLKERTSRSVECRFEAAESLSGEELSPDDVLTVLEWIAVDRNAWVRRALLEALIDMDEDYWAGTILRFIEDPDPNLRRLAAEYAEDHVDAQLEPRLIDAARDEPHGWVRAPMLVALGGGLRDESLDLLHAALADPAREVRGAAVEALQDRADPRSLLPLADLLEEGSLPGSDSPIDALAVVGGVEAIGFLERALNAGSPSVRDRAANVLQRLKAAAEPPPPTPGLQEMSTEEVVEVITFTTSCHFSSGYRAPSPLEPDVWTIAPSRDATAPFWDSEPLPGIEPSKRIAAGALVRVDEFVHDGHALWVSAMTEEGDGWLLAEDLRRLTPAEMK